MQSRVHAVALEQLQLAIPMIAKIPRWAWLGSGILTLIAGAINAVGFLSFQHQGVTHVTGSTTLVGLDLARGQWSDALYYAGTAGSFFLGCIMSGALIKDSALKLGRRYGVTLAIESMLLFCAVPFLRRDLPFGICLASCACGLQNGMASTYSGAVLRTTHVSGAFTDLGIFVGQRLTGLAVDGRRSRLCAMLIVMFLAGAIVGTLGFQQLGAETLYIPASTVGLVGLAYALYGHRREG